MTKRTRLIILIICFILFFTITPWIVLYSLGYKIDFKNGCIVATGGIYIRTEPQGTEVTIDSKIDKKTSFFSNSIFVQDLAPKLHNIIIKKSGYFSYYKNIMVKENEVTKLENITLFKNDITFDKIEDNVDYFKTSTDDKFIFVSSTNNKINKILILNLSETTLKNETIWPIKNGQIQEAKWSDDSSKVLLKTKDNYYIFEPFLEKPKITLLPFLNTFKEALFNPQNSNEIFTIKNNNLEYFNILNFIKIPPVTSKIIIKEVLTYKIENNNIIYLALDGNLYKSDILGKVIEKITNSPLTINKINKFKIFTNNFGIIIQENLQSQEGSKLLLLSSQTKIFEEFLDNINEFKISPDNQNIFFITNNNEILLDHSNYIYNENQNQIPQKILLNKFYEKISNCFWLNSNYLILKADNKIKISEIDNRQNINIIDMPDKFLFEGKFYPIENSQIYFNSQNKQIYILTNKSLISSEKLLP
jgi:hypothetical protein